VQPGEVVEDRFEIADLAGRGGMGMVYRARDRRTGEIVALKILHASFGDNAARFSREIRVLAGLRHPGIVRYIADGWTPARAQWLAMEWLEGESLSRRLERSGLTATESLDLARRVAEALGAAHERGVIHRDIKPSNLFLVDGNLERVKVLDFGVARVVDASRASTRTGVMIGTPGYMAPEQVKSERDITARVDVFAVGCLLFECLTGKPAYGGEHMLAILAKIILEDAPRISEARPDLPDAIDALVARAMAKQPDLRPRDGTQLATEIATLGRVESTNRPATTSPIGPALTATERRLLCVVLIGAAMPLADRTIVDAPLDPDTPSVETDRPSGELPIGTVGALEAAARRHGASLDRLADGSYVATVAGAGAASDQVMRAARCALAIKALAADQPIALATGRGVMAGRWPVGEAIDRAAKLLAAGPSRVRLDDITAGLLDARFDVGGDEAGLYLSGERDVVEVRRTLLGKSMPCVGRDRELGVLSGLFDECVGEPVARAVLVTGVEGIGKSRVRFELLRRIEAGEAHRVEVWFGRGDPLRAGSPYGILAPALRRAGGIQEGEPPEVSCHKLRARVMRNASAPLDRTVRFLGELIGVHFPDDDVELTAARQDPLLMTHQVSRAFDHFLAIETSAQPVLIVLEDLHWGDLPTVKLIDSALRNLPDRPWMILALARPEIHDQFPRLWMERGVHELRLEELTRKGSEKLIRRALGDHTDDALVARLIEQAGGNAFYLEELVRAAAGPRDGKRAATESEPLPETVLALVQARLERLELDARRVLRAASVFGRQFWRGGVTALIGTTRETGTRVWLDELVERELISRSPSSRFPVEEEYQIRHALVQQAAYGMLTESDRKLGHALAGEWLELAGELDAMVLAEHFERAGDARAIEHFLRAAEHALAACDFAGAAARAQRGIRCNAQREALGSLRLVEAEALKWAGEFARAASPALDALALLPPGSLRWFAAACEAADAHGKLADIYQLTSIGEQLLSAPQRGEAIAARVSAMAQAAFQLFSVGNYELAQQLLDQIELVSSDQINPGILARVYQTRSSRAMFAGDVGAYLESEQAAAEAFQRAGDQRYACQQHGHVGYACLEIGAYEDAERYLREALSSAMRLGLTNVVATAKHNLGRALQSRGQLAEALAIEDQALEAFRAQGDRRLEGACRVYLSYILLDLGEIDRAEAELRTALPTAQPPMRPQILSSLARVLLVRGRIGNALEVATEAAATLDQLGGVEEGESLVRLMLIETLLAFGERAEAVTAARSAYARLLERAVKISSRAYRQMFVESIPENARTIQLARELGVTDL
jgi:tetratricopeptide (TPR) repeat protein